MKRLILLLFLAISGYLIAQDVKPINPEFKMLQTPNNAVFWYNPVDSFVWVYKGAYGWTRLLGETRAAYKYVPYNGATKDVNLGDRKISSTKQRLPLFNGACQIPTILDNGDGSISVGNGEYHVSTNVEGRGSENFAITGGTFTLTNNTTNYLVADYNSGTPILRVTNDVNEINETTIVPIYTAYRNGNFLHFQNWDALGVALANKVHQSIVKTQRYRRESGLALSEYPTRYLALSSGRVWVGAVPVSVDAIATNTDNLFLFYHSGGVWTSTVTTQYNNTQYDNGTNLVTLTANRYAVNWIFRGIESQKYLYIILGTGDYTLAQANEAILPAAPTAITSHSMLVGKLIVQRDATTAMSIQSAFDTQFSTATPSAHNDLTGRDATDVHQASSVTNTPSGTVTATTVQAAINELDAEKEPVLTKGDLTENAVGLEFSTTRQVIGGATTLTVTSGYIIPTTASATTWDTSYNRSLVGLSVTGTDTRTITLTKQDGSTLTATFTAGGTTLPAGTGYLYNDGSNNYSYSIPELSSLLATGVPANQIPYANGSNGINFSELKTINSTSLLGSGNFTLADVGIINTFTTNQNISAASPYLNIINTNGSSAGSGVKFWNESTQERLNIGYNNSTDEAYIYGAFNDPLKVILNGVEQSRFKTDGVFETRNLSSPPSAARSGFGGFYTYNNLPYFINSTGVATQLGSSGGGNVSNTGTPVAGQFPIWTDATTIKGTDNFKVNTNNSTYHSLEIKSPYPGLLLRDSDYDSNPAPNGRYGEIHYDGNNLILGQQAGASYYHAVFGRNNTYFYSLAADATPSNVLYFNSSTGEVTYGAKPSGGSGMVWPNNAGIPVYSGSSSWSTSITIPNNTTTFLRGDGTFASVPGGFLDPMTTRGDIIYRNSSNTTTRLGLGLNGQVLSSNGSDLVWATPAGGGNVSNSGTPVSGQLATWNSSTTIYGANVLTTDGFGLNVTSSAGNDPQIKFIDGDVSSRNLTQYFQTNAHIFRYYDGSSSWYPLTLKYTGLTTPAIVLTDINSGSYEDINGSIVYNGTDFLGKVGGTWKSLTAGAGGGSGTVTNFSAGNLNPLFTTSVANSTTTPALSFSLSSASSYTVFGNQTAGTTTPSYGKLHVNTINATGTPSSSTFLRGDGTWSTPAGSTNYWTYSAPNLYPNNLTDNLALGTADAGAYKLKVVGNSRVEGQLSVNWTTGGSAYSVFVNSNSALAAGFFDNSSTGRGIYVRAFSNIPAVLEVTNPTIDNTIETILELRRMNNGSPGTGAGAGILFTHEIQGVTDPVKFATIASKSTDVTASSEDGSLIFSTVKDGTVSQKMSLDNDGRVVVNSSVDIGDDSASASSNNVGAIRYRVSGNNSYCEMVMQTGASTYAWVIIKQNTW